ncbi:FHA domain-containing protein [Azotobacter sp. CWF10]
MRLTVLEYGGEAPSPPLSMLFNAPGGTIGRGTDNHLVLPDDTRQISRLQAVLQVGEAGAQLKNLSPVCPIEINEKPLAQQEEHPCAPATSSASAPTCCARKRPPPHSQRSPRRRPSRWRRSPRLRRRSPRPARIRFRPRP